MKFEIAKKDRLAKYAKDCYTYNKTPYFKETHPEFKGKKVMRIYIEGKPMPQKDMAEFKKRGYIIKPSSTNKEKKLSFEKTKSYKYWLGW